MQLRQVEVFHAVMITGSTVAAAEHLHVTQPAVSTTLRRMQDELGLTLFATVRGRLVPTPEARILFRQVRGLHEEMTQLDRLARRLATGRVGHVRFGTVPAFGDGIAARTVAAMRRDAPDTEVSIDVLNTHELLHRLQGDRLDIACVFGAHAHMPVRILGRHSVEIVGVVPEDWLGTASEIRLEDLNDHPVAIMRTTDPIGYLIEEACRARGVTLHSPLELRSCRAAIALAREGVAIGLSDAVSVTETALGGSRIMPFAPALAIDVTIAACTSMLPVETETRFVAHLSTVLGETVRRAQTHEQA